MEVILDNSLSLCERFLLARVRELGLRGGPWEEVPVTVELTTVALGTPCPCVGLWLAAPVGGVDNGAGWFLLRRATHGAVESCSCTNIMWSPRRIANNNGALPERKSLTCSQREREEIMVYYGNNHYTVVKTFPNERSQSGLRNNQAQWTQLIIVKS